MDYTYLKSEDKSEGDSVEEGMPILVLKDRKTKAIVVNVAPEKGVNASAVKKLPQ